MNSKVKPSQVLSKTIENLLNGSQPAHELLTELLRLGAERILQETTEPIKARLKAVYFPVDLETAQGLATAFMEEYAAPIPR